MEATAKGMIIKQWLEQQTNITLWMEDEKGFDVESSSNDIDNEKIYQVHRRTDDIYLVEIELADSPEKLTIALSGF